MQQPKLRSKVRGTDREIGEVTRIIVDPLSHHISHLVVSMNGRGGPERQIESSHIQSVGDDLVQLRLSSGEVEGLPLFTRDAYVSIHDIEIAHLEATGDRADRRVLGRDAVVGEPPAGVARSADDARFLIGHARGAARVRPVHDEHLRRSALRLAREARAVHRRDRVHACRVR